MSASFQKEDTNWLLNHAKNINELEEALLFSAFDTETNFDIDKIQKEMEQTKFLKKVCFIKLLTFIPEYVLTFFMFERKYSIAKRRIAKLYYNFLFNKINLNNFKKELKNLTTNNII
jgi:hypothetical protein